MLKIIADLHTHTVFSDGRLSPQEVLQIAADKGYRVGLADHCGPGNFQLDSEDRFEKYLAAIRDLPVYHAVELDLGREIPVSSGKLKRCHYLIGGEAPLRFGRRTYVGIRKVLAHNPDNVNGVFGD